MRILKGANLIERTFVCSCGEAMVGHPPRRGRWRCREGHTFLIIDLTHEATGIAMPSRNDETQKLGKAYCWSLALGQQHKRPTSAP